MNEVRERLHTVDGDDGDALAVALLQLRVAADVGLLQLERDFGANLLEDASCGLAKVTFAREVEPDLVHRKAQG